MRRRHGSETWHRLLEWDRGSAAAERLAAQVLRHERFQSVDPSHPLGGRDKLRDVVCTREGGTWVGAAYFPRNQQNFGQIKKKFLLDHKGVTKHHASGFAFVTNQELKLGERSKLTDSVDSPVELFHLERLAGILDQPTMYGVRLEFLDIEMTKEEQLAFIAGRDESFLHVRTDVERILRLLTRVAEGDEDALSRLRSGVPIEGLREFKNILDSVVGDTMGGLMIPRGPISNLRVPLEELREFKDILDSVVESVAALDVPLDQIRQYEETLDRIIENRRKLDNDGV